MMKRRKFITLLGGAAAAWPLAARGQQSAKLPTIGLVGGAIPSTQGTWVAAFVRRLRELGWIENRAVAIEVRWAEGRNERYSEIAAEFVRLKVDVIVTQGTPATIAAKQVTSVIPIVFVAAADPVGTGLVASLARPGGNVSGLSNQLTHTAAKRLANLREACPGLRRLAIGECWQSRFGVRDARGSGSGQRPWRRSRHLRNSTSGGYRACLRGVQGPRGCTLRRERPPLKQQSRSHQQLGVGRAGTDDARSTGVRRSGRPDVLSSNHPRPVPTRGRVCRQDSARRNPCRPSSRTANEVRPHCQPDHCQAARIANSRGIPPARRRGDRIM